MTFIFNPFTGNFDADTSVSLAAVGSSPNANGATLIGQVLNLEPASASFPGVITTGAQTIAGAKTFSSTIVGSISGNAATVTTNANLTGDVTSVGNATTYAGTVPINKGGTGQVTAQAAVDALLPAQGSANGKFLTSNGTTSSWGMPALTAPNSSVFLNTGLGHGSSGTAIRTFTNSTTTGSDLTYTASATNGDKVTVNTTGIYNMGWYDRNSGGAYNFGFTKNQANLTQDATSVSSSERIFYGINSTTVGDQTYATAYLTAGDVVRFNDGGSANNTAPLVQAFIIRIA